VKRAAEPANTCFEVGQAAGQPRELPWHHRSMSRTALVLALCAVAACGK
jgi:hypothetical protein